MSVDPETMEELLARESSDSALRPLRRGDTVEGTIASISGEEATIDLGERSAGVLPLREAAVDQLSVGDAISATVVQPESSDGRVVLSLRRARSGRQWGEMEELQRSGRIIEAPVIDANRGGAAEPVRALVGKRLRVRVMEVDPKRDRLILSEKAATQQLRRERKAEGVASYGVFVDVGVADGLVHRSEITWDKGVEPTSLFRVSQHVRVIVTSIDRDRQRISLSMKRLTEDPWERFARDVSVGQTLQATVTRVMPYGAFAKVADGVEGLVHVSELADHRVADPSEVVRMGEVLPVKIVSVDTERRRLSLSARLADRG